MKICFPSLFYRLNQKRKSRLAGKRDTGPVIFIVKWFTAFVFLFFTNKSFGVSARPSITKEPQATLLHPWPDHAHYQPQPDYSAARLNQSDCTTSPSMHCCLCVTSSQCWEYYYKLSLRFPFIKYSRSRQNWGKWQITFANLPIIKSIGNHSWDWEVGFASLVDAKILFTQFTLSSTVPDTHVPP